MNAKALVRTGRVELPCSCERWNLNPAQQHQNHSKRAVTAVLPDDCGAFESVAPAQNRHKNRHISEDSGKPAKSFSVKDLASMDVRLAFRTLGLPSRLRRAYFLDLKEARSYVYFMRNDNGIIKIGFSKHPEQRREEIRDSEGMGGLDVEIIAAVPGGRVAEQFVHGRFDSSRTERRSEWFFPSPELSALMEACAAQHPSLQAVSL